MLAGKEALMLMKKAYYSKSDLTACKSAWNVP
jgi:hypothetical protein